MEDELVVATFALPERLVKEMDRLIMRGKYSDRSEVIRSALELYFNTVAKRWLESAEKRRAKRAGGR
ncbi:MAG: ribbon-helix-helix domain-containing protein [Thermoproteus sp. AZ2]|jgi:Arc/MetJ-type ribon-helix-helix transcriptional regulator|uniref:Ribbon-helix-helix domain-containing protein n=1 Tax=Thermoproteus sp. AZ2 TaxID=1609232 RepID=A0ACC6UYD2_9CREN|nr:MAG: hypothetical protein TU35_08800 [Thermoproteus sp. AZ2]